MLCMYLQTLTFHTSTATQCTVIIISDDISNTEALNSKIALAAVVVWVLVGTCVISGIVCCGKFNWCRLLHIYIYIYIYENAEVYTNLAFQNIYIYICQYIYIYIYATQFSQFKH